MKKLHIEKINKTKKMNRKKEKTKSNDQLFFLNKTNRKENAINNQQKNCIKKSENQKIMETKHLGGKKFNGKHKKTWKQGNRIIF
jgi:hypothetical protein